MITERTKERLRKLEEDKEKGGALIKYLQGLDYGERRRKQLLKTQAVMLEVRNR